MNKSIRGRYYRWQQLLRSALFTAIPGYLILGGVMWLTDESFSRTGATLTSYPFMLWLVLLSALRQGELSITGIKDLDALRSLVCDKLESSGFRQVAEDTWLPEGKWSWRLHQWFGMGAVQVRWSSDGCVLTGPYRIVDEVDARLTFGRVRIS